MNEYKPVSKFLEKKRNEFDIKIFIKKLISKVLICVILLLVGLIVLRYDKNGNGKIYSFIYESNFSFAKLNELYQKYLGDILPFQSASSNKIPVFSEPLEYTSLSIYKDGININVEKDYLIPALENGVVVFVGEKEHYGNTIIIQQTDGVDVWYGNVTNINVDLYDYVNKGEFLAVPKNTSFYLVFQKEGKYINYKDYLA